MSSGLNRPLHKGAIVLALVTWMLLTRAAECRIQAQEPSERAVIIHITEPGQTLEEIAVQYGAIPAAILDANRLSSPSDIHVGQRLLIPTSPYLLPEPPIQIGIADTLYTLAAQYGVTVGDLGRALRVVNPLGLFVGQSLYLGGPSTASEGSDAHLLRYQEIAIWQIALRANKGLYEITIPNQIVDPAIVAPEQLLKVPASDGAETDQLLPLLWVEIMMHPVPLEAGRTGGLRITTSRPGILRGSFLDKELNVVSDDEFHRAVFGVHRWTEPGLYPLRVTYQDELGQVWTLEKLVLIADGMYEQEALRIPERVASVLNDPQAVQDELAYIAEKMTGFTTSYHWDGLFLLPTPGVYTSAFGTVRSYNGGPFDTFHSGADFAGRIGAPIYAPANGIVVDIGSLDIRGLITIIDHGGGVYSGYWHQSSILVDAGENVSAGQQIGTMGTSGLSTAAHLHWEIWAGGVQVDALQWVREQFP